MAETIKLDLWMIVFFSFFLFFCSLGPHPPHMEVPRLGVELELQLAAYTTAHDNVRSLTHSVRPGIKPTISWFPVRFFSAVPQIGTPEWLYVKTLPVECFYMNKKQGIFYLRHSTNLYYLLEQLVCIKQYFNLLYH